MINSQHTDENQLELSRSFVAFFFSGVPSPISQRDDENTSPAYFLVEGQLWKLPSLVKVLLFFCFLVFFSGRLCLIEIHS